MPIPHTVETKTYPLTKRFTLTVETHAFLHISMLEKAATRLPSLITSDCLDVGDELVYVAEHERAFHCL